MLNIIWNYTSSQESATERGGEGSISYRGLLITERKLRSRKNPEAKEKGLPLESVVIYMAVLLYNELTYEIYKLHVSPRKESSSKWHLMV